MCTLGPLTNKELTHEKVEGYRGWFIKNIKEGDNLNLYPLNRHLNTSFEKGESKAILDRVPFLESNAGFYAYNYAYNYYNYNYNNYNNYNYYNYYVGGKVVLSENIANHEEGYRATKAKPSLLVKLTPKDINEDFNKFISHFNSLVDKVAAYYEVPTIFHKDFK